MTCWIGAGPPSDGWSCGSTSGARSDASPGRAKTGGIAAGLDDLPLFAASAEVKEDSNPDPLSELLKATDADMLTPREALELVYRLKALADAGRSEERRV